MKEENCPAMAVDIKDRIPEWYIEACAAKHMAVILLEGGYINSATYSNVTGRLDRYTERWNGYAGRKQQEKSVQQ